MRNILLNLRNKNFPKPGFDLSLLKHGEISSWERKNIFSCYFLRMRRKHHTWISCKAPNWMKILFQGWRKTKARRYQLKNWKSCRKLSNHLIQIISLSYYLIRSCRTSNYLISAILSQKPIVQKIRNSVAKAQILLKYSNMEKTLKSALNLC